MFESLTFTPISQSIVKTLLYYDIFNYPLKSSEIFRFLGAKKVDEATVNEELNLLCNKGLVFRFDNFFSLQNNEHNIIRRINGNIEAKRYCEIAKKQAKLIMRFPFVKAVMASGSLSKEFMDENSDIDFFILTKPGRLWIARTLLVTYKRIFLFNSHKYFCVNYFIDTDHLHMEDQNLFTATELATLLPLCGAEYYQKLHDSNTWIREIFPNYRPRSTDGLPSSKASGTKRALEFFLNLLFGNQINRLLMLLTFRRWKRRYQNQYADADFKLAFKTKEYVSKNHPKHYQSKVIEQHEYKWKEFLTRLPSGYHVVATSHIKI